MRTIGFIKVAAVATVLVAAVVAVHLVRARSSRRTTTSVAASSFGTPGRQITWAVSFQARLRQTGDSGQAVDTTTALAGDWTATVVGVSEGGFDLAYELRRPRVTGAGFGEVAAAEVERLERSLSEPFWVSYQRDGAAKWLHFPRDMHDDVRNLLTLLVTEVQLVRPAPHSPQWTAVERDGAGTYFASYRETETGEIAKRKLRYLSVDGATEGAVNVQIAEAEARFCLDADGRIDRVTASDRMYVDTTLGGAGLNIDLRVELGHPQAGRDSDLVGSLERERPRLETSPVAAQHVGVEVMQARQDARLLKDVNPAELFEAVSAHTIDARTRATLVALLRQRPAELPKAIAYARRSNRDVAKVILDAAGSAETPFAQSALCAVAGDESTSTTLRTDAIAALIQTKRPTSSTVEQLVRLLDAGDPTVSKQALYVVGAIGGASQDRDANLTTRIESELLRRQNGCRGDQCADVLVAFGNLATPSVIPAIERGLDDPSAHVRAAAARALRKIKAPSADRLIAATMKADRDPGVRSAAVFAATYRPIGPLLEPLTQLLREDPIDFVRTHAIEAVASHVDESRLVENALIAAATGDRSPGVRRLAREALGSRMPTSPTIR